MLVSIKKLIKKTNLLFILILSLMSFQSKVQQTEIKYLSGLDKDNTVEWDFFCTKGKNSGKWSKIQVPSCWELQYKPFYTFSATRAEE